MLMESRVEILRGWPADGSREKVQTIASGVTLVNGDFVTLDASGNLIKTTAATRACGVVVRGNGDSGASANTNKAVVVWGNYIARIDSTTFAAGAFVPGSPVAAAAGGLVALSAGAVTDVGYVLDVVAAGSTQTAHLTVCMF
jgi:hypothetical protein